jgi:hypothetical protein
VGAQFWSCWDALPCPLLSCSDHGRLIFRELLPILQHHPQFNFLEVSKNLHIEQGMSSISELTEQITRLTTQLSTYLTSFSQPNPNFTASSYNLPETVEYEALRAPLNDALLDLLRLINGPKGSLRGYFLFQYDLAALQVALDRGFFHHVALPASATDSENLHNGNRTVKEGTSVTEVAAKANMDVDRTGRILRLLATHRIFEHVPGEIESFKHTAASALFATDEDLHAMADFQ